ncbi:SMI1/KNR4 family protein [Mucilaginibacter rubeus]|uniref:SMI1/KNR4 family protein n=1 Tax=Mucilaginibacter rubeus TaxID=2027860 RepID=A0A5C1I542_9SPHI|nr:SMI1/KNR4 family protein [Mucilaginibacter rubeus]QEM12944.1 SMI1/KNR4 family protein [Mucilaginibacter rubeus]
MVEFFNTENNLTVEQIRLIASKYQLVFPDEYVDHLLINNGGQCHPNVFEFIENGQLTESNVDWFLAIYDGRYDSLEQYIKVFKKDQARIPDSFIPIAHDPGGNLICISCVDKKIYYWDHEKEMINADHNGAGNIHFIARNLETFLNSLR